MEGTVISDKTKITLGFFLLIAGAIFSYGVMYQKVNNVDEKITNSELRQDSRMVRMEDKIDKILETKLTAER